MKRHRWTALVLVFVSTTGIGSLTSVQAGPISYNSVGIIDQQYYFDLNPADPNNRFPNLPPHFTGPAMISFQGVIGGSLNPSAPFPLGDFVITPVPAPNTISTYMNTPFTIEIRTPSINRYVGSGPGAGEHYGSLDIHGYLNGTVNGSGRSNVTATIDSMRLGSVSAGPFPTVNLFYEFPFPLDSIKIDHSLSLASQSGGGRFTLFANVEPVPEPSSIAVFLVAAAGLGYRRFRAISRQR